MTNKDGRGGWSAVFGCTYEGLALFRIVLGVLLTSELILRFRFLHVYYTDEGTMPLKVLLPKIDEVYRFVCYHCHFGSLLQQQILLSIQVLVSICFTLGYGYGQKTTKLMSILSFYMYTSLILRCTWLYFILDRYFYYLLFYSMFLPLNEKWSINNNNNNNNTNNKNNDKCGKLFVNPATVAIKLLVLWIYLDAGIGKYIDVKHGWTYHADPLPALDTYARHTLPAQYLYTILGPHGLRLLTPTVVYVEIFVVPIVLIGSYFRKTNIVNVAIFIVCSMHIGISFTIRNSNLLSYIACCVWILFLPVDNFVAKTTTAIDGGGEDLSEATTTTSTTSATTTTTSSSKSKSKSNPSLYNKLGSLVTLLMVGGMVGGNIWFETIGLDCSTESLRLIWSTLLQNRWNVFNGAEEYVTWEIAPGRLQDGSIVDVWGRTDHVNWLMPGSGAPCTSTARPGRWRSFPYLAELDGDEAEALWGYLCREWDRENNVKENPGQQLLRYNFFMLQADVLPNMGFSSTRKRLVYSHECVKEKELNADREKDNEEQENIGLGQEL